MVLPKLQNIVSLRQGHSKNDRRECLSLTGNSKTPIFIWRDTETIIKSTINRIAIESSAQRESLIRLFLNQGLILVVL